MRKLCIAESHTIDATSRHSHRSMKSFPSLYAADFETLTNYIALGPPMRRCAPRSMVPSPKVSARFDLTIYTVKKVTDVVRRRAGGSSAIYRTPSHGRRTHPETSEGVLNPRFPTKSTRTGPLGLQETFAPLIRHHAELSKDPCRSPHIRCHPSQPKAHLSNEKGRRRPR